MAFTFVFSDCTDGRQTGTVRYATGAQARQPEPAGEVLTTGIPVSFGATTLPVRAGQALLCAGLRSDPFFAEAEGAGPGFPWTGHDGFAGHNVDSIAVQVPHGMLGTAPVIGVWASVSRRCPDGTLEQPDRGGHPDILCYDRTRAPGYPNGRVLTDDVYSQRFAWLGQGKIPPAGLKPRNDLLPHFPYLGPPNP